MEKRGNRGRWLTRLLLSVITIAGLLPVVAAVSPEPAEAAEILQQEEVSYCDENGTVQTVLAKVCQPSTSQVLTHKITLGSGFYVLNADLNYTSGIYFTCTGNATLILADGVDYSFSAVSGQPGINVPEGTSLTIYGSATYPGAITVYGGEGCAGIGGRDECSSGKISIYGGTVNAYGGDGAAGIGGGEDGGSALITIGGTASVTAVGGEEGAGIGSGEGGTCNGVTINGGEVTATSGGQAAGIGAGHEGFFYNITINGGTVTAKGASDCDYSCTGIGVGCGSGRSDDPASSGITITGGKVIATGSGPQGAGIGSGISARVTNIKITGGEVTATGSNAGAGIGESKNAYSDYCQSVSIEGGTVIAEGGNEGPGICARGPIKISGGKVKATGHYDKCGIGNYGWWRQGAVAGGIEISGGEVEAHGGDDGGAGIGSFFSGSVDGITISGGKVTAYGGLKSPGIGAADTVANDKTDHYAKNITISGGEVHAYGGKFGAGIGGGYGVTVSNLNITGGTVTATGGQEGAGIGCGDAAKLTSLTIIGGTITAQGGDGAAGIGGGESSTVSSLSISGGTITATGGASGAGIGAGSSGAVTSLEITNGNITAQGGTCGAGIGGGFGCTVGTIAISGGTVKATGGNVSNNGGTGNPAGVGIGAGVYKNSGSVVISGGEIEAKGGKGVLAKAIGYGNLGEASNCSVCVDTSLHILAGSGADDAVAICTGRASDTDISADTASRKNYMKISSHSYQAAWTSDGTQHWHACAVCGDKADAADHTGGTATCEHQAVCETCGQEYGSLLDHVYTTTTTKATLTADGKIVRSCSVCGEVASTTTIKKASKITCSATSFTYDGKVHQPTITVKDSAGNALSANSYTVSMPSSINPGTYTATVTLKGNYRGSKTFTYTIVPKAVTGVKAAAKSYNSIQISWTKHAGVSGYEIYRATSKTGTYSKVGTVASGSTVTYTNTGVNTGTTYYYKVRAFKTVDGKKLYGSYSAIKSAKTTLGAPTLSSVVNKASKKAVVTWSKVAGASGYEVYRATSKTGTYSKVATLASSTVKSFTNTGLTKGKTYYYKVLAYRTVNGKRIYSTYSAIKSVKITK